MPRERGGVVDSRLNVYGVRGLKVASAMPATLYRRVRGGKRSFQGDTSVRMATVVDVRNTKGEGNVAATR